QRRTRHEFLLPFAVERTTDQAGRQRYIGTILWSCRMTERVQPDRDEFAKAKRDTWNTTDYGSWFKPARGQVIDTLEKAALAKGLGTRKYERALDVGIGNGRLLPIYAPHAAHITGMD